METYPVARAIPLRSDAKLVERLYALTRRPDGDPVATVILCNEGGRPCRVVRLHTESELNNLRLVLERLQFTESDVHHITDEHGQVLEVWVPDPSGRFRRARVKREAAAHAEEYDDFDEFEDPQACAAAEVSRSIPPCSKPTTTSNEPNSA